MFSNNHKAVVFTPGRVTFVREATAARAAACVVQGGRVEIVVHDGFQSNIHWTQ